MSSFVNRNITEMINLLLYHYVLFFILCDNKHNKNNSNKFYSSFVSQYINIINKCTSLTNNTQTRTQIKTISF